MPTNVVVRSGKTWLNEDGNYTTDRVEAKVMPYEVAEAYIMATWQDKDTRWIEPDITPAKRTPFRVRWLMFQIKFLQSFHEPNDTTMFPGWIAKQINKRLDKIEKLKRGCVK